MLCDRGIHLSFDDWFTELFDGENLHLGSMFEARKLRITYGLWASEHRSRLSNISDDVEQL